MHVLDRVLFCGLEALALLGEHVDDDGAVELGGVGEGFFNLGDVVSVEGSQVVDSERLEECGRFKHLADGRLGGADATFEEFTDPGELFGQLL